LRIRSSIWRTSSASGDGVIAIFSSALIASSQFRLYETLMSSLNLSSLIFLKVLSHFCRHHVRRSTALARPPATLPTNDGFWRGL
jgi:hypothetical protein